VLSNEDIPTAEVVFQQNGLASKVSQIKARLTQKKGAAFRLNFAKLNEREYNLFRKDVVFKKLNYMFRPILVIFRFPQV
jgi:hypothetical protein